MFKKEIKKIKDLINKLKTEGDVTEDEADWLYIAKSVLFAENYHRNSCKSYLHPDCYMAEPYLAFGEWYALVKEKIQEEEENFAKNFATTLPFYEDDVSMYFGYPGQISDIYLKSRESVFLRKEKECNEVFLSRTERLLTGDVLALPENRFSVTRFGIVERIMGKMTSLSLKDEEKEKTLTALGIPFIKRSIEIFGETETVLIYPERDEETVNAVLSGEIRKAQESPVKPGMTKDKAFILRSLQTLESTGDISEEDADAIFLLFKFSQQLIRDNRSGGKKKQTEELLKYLDKWYGAVYRMLSQGKSGNFETTVPLSERDVLYAGKNLKKCIESLSEESCFLILPGQRNFDAYDSVGFHSEITGNGTLVVSSRRGMIEKATDIREYAVADEETDEEKADKMYNTFVQWKMGKYEDCSLIGELKAMKRAKIDPALAGFPGGSVRIMVPKEDVVKVRKIAEMRKEIDSEDFEKGFASNEDDGSWTDTVR